MDLPVVQQSRGPKQVRGCGRLIYPKVPMASFISTFRFRPRLEGCPPRNRRGAGRAHYEGGQTLTEEREKRSGWDGYLSATDRVLTGLMLGKDGLWDDFDAILTISASSLLVCAGAEEEVDKQGNRSVSVDGDGNGDGDGAANETQINASASARSHGTIE